MNGEPVRFSNGTKKVTHIHANNPENVKWYLEMKGESGVLGNRVKRSNVMDVVSQSMPHKKSD